MFTNISRHSSISAVVILLHFAIREWSNFRDSSFFSPNFINLAENVSQFQRAETKKQLFSSTAEFSNFSNFSKLFFGILRPFSLHIPTSMSTISPPWKRWPNTCSTSTKTTRPTTSTCSGVSTRNSSSLTGNSRPPWVVGVKCANDSTTRPMRRSGIATPAGGSWTRATVIPSPCNKEPKKILFFFLSLFWRIIGAWILNRCVNRWMCRPSHATAFVLSLPGSSSMFFHAWTRSYFYSAVIFIFGGFFILSLKSCLRWLFSVGIFGLTHLEEQFGTIFSKKKTKFLPQKIAASFLKQKFSNRKYSSHVIKSNDAKKDSKVSFSREKINKRQSGSLGGEYRWSSGIRSMILATMWTDWCGRWRG